MGLAQDQYGWIMCDVLGMRRQLLTVLINPGASVTAAILKTYQYPVAHYLPHFFHAADISSVIMASVSTIPIAAMDSLIVQMAVMNSCVIVMCTLLTSARLVSVSHVV
jgi:hypothetical protein